jgi:hypothetical protein
VTALKQADEFGLSAKAKIVPLQSVLTDVYAVGLKTAHDAYEVSPFYWDRTPETRTWAECFYAGCPPVGPSSACVSRALAVLSGIAGSRKTPRRASVVAPTWAENARVASQAEEWEGLTQVTNRIDART